ncbi:MAG: IS66 family transposase [Coxiellaceae bacterium]|nr:IS66 family transposase [Coxiellaceae bacterium]
MHQEAEAYKSKYESILEQLRLAKQKRFATSSEKNLLQPDIFDEAGVDLPEAVTQQLSEEKNEKDGITVAEHTRSKKPKRCKLPEDLPREIILHDLSDAEKVCGCGAHLVKIGEEVSEQLKYIPAKLSVVAHVRPKYACKPCQENVKIAAMPSLLLPKSIATPELVAHIIISKYCDHLPLYRQEKMWERIAVDLPRSSLCAWVLKTAELCHPLIEQLQKNITTYDYAQADETTVQVMNEKDRKNTSKSYMWCYRGGNKDGPVIVYDYQETRGGYHAENFLSGFKGYLQTDAYSGYNWTLQNKDIVSVGCNAHARRNFAELVKISKTPGLAAEALLFYKKLYKIEAQARDNNLTPEQRHKLREKESKPIVDAFKRFLDHHLTKTSEQGKIGKAIRYCLNHWEQLSNFLKDGRIEIDNNLCENAIRPFTLGRKNWLFMGSPSGAKAGATFYSLIETCKANKIDPQKYLTQMLHKIHLCKTDDDYRNLLPQNFKLDARV